MRKKSPMIAVSICMLIFTLAMTMTCVASPNPPTVSISPTTITGPPPDVGDNFTISIKIKDVIDLYLYNIGLSWNSSVLEGLNWTFDSTFFPAAITLPGVINNTSGETNPPFAATLTDPPHATGVSGSGTLATVKFRVVGYGESWINFTLCDLLDSWGRDISRDLVNGTFEVSPVAPEGKVPWLGIIVGLVVVVVMVFVYMVMRRRHS